VTVAPTTKTVAIMQPYLLPYLGYFSLIQAADVFVIYDDVQYIRRGWINGNRIRVAGQVRSFVLPVSKAPQATRICDMQFAPGFQSNKQVIRGMVQRAYADAPYAESVTGLLETILAEPSANVATFVGKSIQLVSKHLGQTTMFAWASSQAVPMSVRGEDRILSLCKAFGATHYVNPIGGVDLYDRQRFAEQGIQLGFLRPELPEYEQGGQPWEPGLSIVDVLAWNSPEHVRSMLKCSSVQ
jgi:hypothetical protein